MTTTDTPTRVSSLARLRSRVSPDLLVAGLVLTTAIAGRFAWVATESGLSALAGG